MLSDAGSSASKGTIALVVVTPGVKAEAYQGWVEALEDEGLDAWMLRFPAQGQDARVVRSAIEAAAQELTSGGRPLVVAAHGLGGVFVLQAEIQPQRMALVGTPLAAQAVPVRTQPLSAVVQEGLPFPPVLLGPLPQEPLSASLARDYLLWMKHGPELQAPRWPTLLVASGLDLVAPPEVVRLPSQEWSARSWSRSGPLGLEGRELRHGELLSDPSVAQQVAEFLAE